MPKNKRPPPPDPLYKVEIEVSQRELRKMKKLVYDTDAINAAQNMTESVEIRVLKRIIEIHDESPRPVKVEKLEKPKNKVEPENVQEEKQSTENQK